MAIETTPLGFQKPDGNELVRQGDNVIAANAQKSQDLIGKARADIVNLQSAAGFDGDPLVMQDAVVAELLTTESVTSNAIGTLVSAAVEESSDATVAANIGTPTSETATALSAAYAFKPDNGARPVGKGELFINVKDYGAKADYNSATKVGTDDTAAINAAAAAAFAIGPEAVLYIPYGKYKITGTVTFQCSLEASAASFFYEGTGVAVQLGSSTPGISCTRKTIKLPRVHQWTKNYNPTSHDGTSVGVKAYNLNGCDLYVPFIQWFEDGLVMYGNGAGNGYNTVYLQTLWGNHRNIVIDNDGVGGWTNQITWIGGRLTPASWYMDDPTGTFIYCNGNNNNFIGTSMEGGAEYRYRIWIFNRYNYFYNARLEATSGGNPKIIYKAASAFNRIVGGYNMFNVEEVFESGASGGTIQDGGDIYGKATSVAAATLTTGVASTVKWVGFIGNRITYDAATGEFKPRPGKWRITARVAFNASGTGNRQVSLVCGTSTVDSKQEGGFGGSLSNPGVAGTYRFNGTETFKVMATQTSGADLTLNATNFFSNVRAEYLPD